MKNKILIFTAGLLAGLIIGVLFSVAIKELLIQFREVHLSLNKINLKQSQLSQRLDSIQGKLVPDTKKTTVATIQSNIKTTVQSPQKNSASKENGKKHNQTISNNVSNASDDDNDSDIVVMTNQLVSVLSAHLQNKDTSTVNKKTEEADSTIAAMSDVGAPPQSADWRIEFWKSPLNYKGYKMSMGKIVLYGINPDTPVNLTLEQGAYYLLVNRGAYRLDFTDDYRPFERVTDKIILKKLGI